MRAPFMSRGLVPRFSPSSGGRRTKAFVYATSGTKPGASDKGASAAPRQQGVSCGQPPLPLREFAPCRARRRIPRDALLIAGDGLKNKKAGGYVTARHEKRRRGYPHPGREKNAAEAIPIQVGNRKPRRRIRAQAFARTAGRNNAPRSKRDRQTSRLLDVASPIWITPVGRNMAKGVKIYAGAGTPAKA